MLLLEVVAVVVVEVVVVVDEDKGAILEVEEFNAAGALLSKVDGCDGGFCCCCCDGDEEVLAAEGAEGLLTAAVDAAEEAGAFVSRNRLAGSCVYCLGELGAVEVGVECIER